MIEIIEHIKKKHHSDSELLTINKNIREIEFSANKLANIKNISIEGHGIRIINDGKLGFVSSNRLKNDNINYLSKSAAALAKYGEPASFVFPEKCQPHLPEIYDEKTESVALEKLIETGTHIIDKLNHKDDNLKININLLASVIENNLNNSAGLQYSYKSTSCNLEISATRVDDSGFLTIYDYYSSRRIPDENSISELIENIDFNIKHSKTITNIDKGTYLMLFTPKAVAMILNILLYGFNGKLVNKNMSYISDKRENKILSDKLTANDDPHINFGIRSFPIDTEGTETSPLKLIENGIIKNFITDLQAAGFMKKESTGHGYRSYNSTPTPNFSNIVISPGPDDLKKTIKNLDNVILIDQLLGSGQGNVLAGEYSTNIDLGYLVKKGEIAGRIKNCMTTGNIYKLFNNIVEIGTDTRCLGNIHTPSILFGNCSLT